MDDLTFIHDVARRLACDERRAEGLTFAVFQELRDRLTPKEAADVDERSARGIGIGWHLAPDRRAGDVWWHNGGSEGYTAMLQIAPQVGIAIAVLTNGARGAYRGPDRLAKRVLEAMLTA